jgi:hypothetical protein
MIGAVDIFYCQHGIVREGSKAVRSDSSTVGINGVSSSAENNVELASDNDVLIACPAPLWS